MKSWREIARPIICEVLMMNAGKPEAEIRKALFQAYPFGTRRMHPYKIWLDEIRKQRGIKPKPTPITHVCGRPVEQLEMFSQ